MSIGQTPTCHWPQGGPSKSSGGRGIFRDSAGEPIKIWVDYMLRSATSIIQAARHEDDQFQESGEPISSVSHSEPETQIIILHPASHHIFDLYCHPNWLTAWRRKEFDTYREEHGDEEEEWTRKVMLKESWVRKCLDAGRFLGEGDAWGGCRVGGPPKGQVVDMPMDIDTIMLNDGVKPTLSADDFDVDMGQNDVEDEKEDVKPIVVTEPIADVPDLVAVEVESPIPHPPIDEIRPDLTTQPIEEDEAEPLFQHREPSPPPVRRSSRKSRSTSQLQQVKDELESSDEEALATSRIRHTGTSAGSSRAPSKRIAKRNAATSPVGDDYLDIAMLDSGPSSRFPSPRPSATPVGEGKILSGLVFWVDLGLNNRGDLLKDIKTAGGKIVADHGDATHVLIYKFAHQAIRWKEVIAELAPKGVWFLTPDWAKKSVAEKKRLPEKDFVLPGGHLAIDSVSGDDKAIDIYNADIREVHKQAVEQALSVEEVARRLVAKHPSLPFSEWKTIYQSWIRRDSLLPATPRSKAKPKPSAFAPLQETVLEIKAESTSGSPIKSKLNRLSKQELEAIFAKESWRYYTICGSSMGEYSQFLAGTYLEYTAGSWREYYGKWLSGRGRWADTPRTFHGAILTPDELSQGPITTIATPRRNTVEIQDQSIRLPISEMAIAIRTHFVHSEDRVIIKATSGERMEALYPAYTAREWEKLAREWKDGSDRFADCGPRWSGKLSAADEASGRSAGEPVNPVAVPIRYTDDEELAMGKFIIHQESMGEPITEDSWSIFADVYQERPKRDWVEHWREHKDRLMDIAKRHEATQEAGRSDDFDIDPTYSDRSPSPVASGSQPKPKKQKVSVSKKDYEDLARFIVDNIAEGDVPDSKDFDQFSKDHPERSGSSWYTIWHRDKYRSTLLPLIDELRGKATPSRATSSRATSSRPKSNAYTDEEERAMAEFIVRHVPSDRPPKVADWNKFQRTHTKRTAPSWTEHYRVYKPRIDALVAEIAAQPSVARPPSGTAQDAIELASEEEEEEEVEDIVPIRAPRKKGSDVIVIVD